MSQESRAIDPRHYYRETIPAAFNRALEQQAADPAADRHVYDEMCAVRASIRIEIRSDPPQEFFLDIEAGRMAPAEQASHPPFLSVALDLTAFERVAREAGDSITALLGSVAGLGDEMRLTAKRVRDLAAVDAAIRVEVTGDTGFDLTLGLGPQPALDAPDATLRMDVGSYRALRDGTLDPQQAFLEDAIQTEGDMEKVLQLAFAAVAPD